MGRDKAWLELEGQPLVVRALAVLREAGIKEVFVSGRAGQDYSSLGCPVLLDLEPGGGPLGGIERALRATSSPLVLVLAVDLPRMSAAFLGKLMARCDPLTGAVPSLRGELEPLAAIYPRRCHSIALRSLALGHRAARGFAEACLNERVVRRFRVATADADCFVNWNRLADLPARAC
jgi:molybdenum cofactor guanylyltransferase